MNHNENDCYEMFGGILNHTFKNYCSFFKNESSINCRA